MLFLKQPFIWPFFHHKSAITCQIDSNKVSSSKLKPDLCNCGKIEMIEFTASSSTAATQTRHTFFGTPCTFVAANIEICFYLLQNPPPWSTEGKKVIEDLGLTIQVTDL